MNARALLIVVAVLASLTWLLTGWTPRAMPPRGETTLPNAVGPPPDVVPDNLVSEVQPPVESRRPVREATSFPSATSTLEAPEARVPRGPMAAEWAALEQRLTGTLWLQTEDRGRGSGSKTPQANFEVDFFARRKNSARFLIDRVVTDSKGRFGLDLHKLRPWIGSVSQLGFSTEDPWFWPQTPDRTLAGTGRELKGCLSKPGEQVDFVLIDLGQFHLKGRVVNFAGAPVPSTRVESVWNESSHWAWTDALGRFEFTSHIPIQPLGRAARGGGPTATVSIQSPRGDKGSQSYQVDTWDSTMVDLGDLVLDQPFDAEATIFGQVLAMNGQPLANWPYGWQPDPGARWSSPPWQFTDDRGDFVQAREIGNRVELYTVTYGEVDFEAYNTPSSGILLQMKRPTASILCIDPEGHTIPPQKNWRIYATTVSNEDASVQLVTRPQIKRFPRGDRLQAIFPETGTYVLRTTWPGLTGDWWIDEPFEVLEDHREIILQANLYPKDLPDR